MLNFNNWSISPVSKEQLIFHQLIHRRAIGIQNGWQTPLWATTPFQAIAHILWSQWHNGMIWDDMGWCFRKNQLVSTCFNKVFHHMSKMLWKQQHLDWPQQVEAWMLEDEISWSSFNCLHLKRYSKCFKVYSDLNILDPCTNGKLQLLHPTFSASMIIKEKKT